MCFWEAWAASWAFTCSLITVLTFSGSAAASLATHSTAKAQAVTDAVRTDLLIESTMFSFLNRGTYACPTWIQTAGPRCTLPGKHIRHRRVIVRSVCHARHSSPGT